jgi:thiol:disulfide interchange protein DsbC
LLPFSADDFLTIAKAGEELELRDCPNPVKEHVVLAQRLGLTGTPMTITDSGEQLNGYVPTNDLVARLQAVKQANRNE